MEFSVPPNIFYMLFCFLLMDFINQIQFLTFATLASTIAVMNNHTLIAHYGIEPTDASMSIMNSLITSSGTVGLITSLFIILPLSEKKGRKYGAVYIRTLLAIVSSLCHVASAFFQATELFIIGQALIGTALPLRMFVTTIYIMECAPDKYRGFTSTALIFSDVIGQILMFSVASPNMLGKENTWFVFPLTVLISSLIIFGLAARLPESPKWLVCQNRMEEAAFKVLIAVTIFLGYDSSSIQGVYTVLLHTAVGFSVQDAMNINLFLSIIMFPTKFIGTYIIDALGRRPVMFIAGVLMYSKTWLMLVTESILFLNGPSELTEILYFSVEFLTQLIPATGVFSVGTLFVTELFPAPARTSVVQCIILIMLLINFPVHAMFPIINSFFAPGFFMPYIFTQFIFGTYLYRHMPETRARAICDIIESLDNEVASRRTSILEEKTPLLRDRARTLAMKRNSILNTPRTRALTFDQNVIPSRWNC